MAAKKGTKSVRGGGGILTAEEKAAMRETVRERKVNLSKAEAKEAVLAKIAAMQPADRALAKRIHAMVTANGPSLSPKLFYGMPAYANEEGKVVCFFQDAAKFKVRYATLGFMDSANLDDGGMWPTSFAVESISPADEAKIIALVKKAVR